MRIFFKIIIFFLIITAVSCKSTKVRTTVKKEKTTSSSYPEKTKPKVASRDTVSAKNEVLVATSKVKVTTDDVKKYISQFKPVVQNNMKIYGVPASIIMAQGILESGVGFGRLAKEANNHFGIKCANNWQGETIYHDDDALQECFRKYPDASESYKDHSLFLKNRPRYKDLFLLDKGDYVGWAKGLKKTGYATDSGYPEKLISLIERYELYTLDNEVLGKPNEPKPETNLQLNDNEYIIQKGDTMYSISKKFKISIEELRKINNIQENSISVGQKIKIK